MQMLGVHALTLLNYLGYLLRHLGILKLLLVLRGRTTLLDDLIGEVLALVRLRWR